MADGGDIPERGLDFKNPDYTSIWNARRARLSRLRANPSRLQLIKYHYSLNPVQFIEDLGCSFDPRLAARGLSPYVPLVLMPRQREMLEWILERWRSGEAGILEKSRDVGASVLSMALACTLCIFNNSMMIGMGSAKEDKLDRSGDPNTLFFKGRTFMENLPVEFRAGWTVEKHAPHMRLLFPHTKSSITGEAGDNIGRGGRSAIYLIDEAAYLEHPALVDGSLLGNTDCRIDMSSVNGMSNSFAQRRHSGTIPVFTFHYRDDLRKDEEWAVRKKATVDPVIWNAEYELDYTASVEGIIIDQAWIQASVDAHLKLNIKPSGVRRGALDVADEGRDVNCFAARHGQLVTHCEVWSGKGSDLFSTTERCFLLCDEQGLEGFDYDADGLGAGVRGDANRILARRVEQGLMRRSVREYRGSGGVLDPDKKADGTDRTALDLYQNMKAQAYFGLRRRFEQTFRAINGQSHDPDLIISLDSRIPDVQKLCIELSQPQWKLSATGKIMVVKAPDGTMSPNRADAVCILFRPRRPPMRPKPSTLEQDW